jgi:ABC-type branched-subunit amino acid transport system ATPase component
VRLFGEDVTKLSPQARAQRGLGRTFQRMEHFDSLNVRENVSLGVLGDNKCHPYAGRITP